MNLEQAATVVGSNSAAVASLPWLIALFLFGLCVALLVCILRLRNSLKHSFYWPDSSVPIAELSKARPVGKSPRYSDVLKQIFEASQEGIWVFDSERRTIHLSPAMEKLLGFKLQEALGKPACLFCS